MHWVLWALVAWLSVSVMTALIVGRVIATRDRREVPARAGDDEDQNRTPPRVTRRPGVDGVAEGRRTSFPLGTFGPNLDDFGPSAGRRAAGGDPFLETGHRQRAGHRRHSTLPK